MYEPGDCAIAPVVLNRDQGSPEGPRGQRAQEIAHVFLSPLGLLVVLCEKIKL